MLGVAKPTACAAPLEAGPEPEILRFETDHALMASNLLVNERVISQWSSGLIGTTTPEQSGA